MPINVGQRGMYREFDSTKPFTVAEVTKHQDENLFGVDTVVRGVKKANGKFVHFDAVTGKEDGDRDAAGGEERATFDGRNIMVGRGARGGNTAFEWINL